MESIGALLTLVGSIALWVIGLFLVLKLAQIVFTLPGRVARLEEKVAKLEKGKK